jgi:hypothetical protein
VTPSIWTEVFHSFPQSFSACAGIVPRLVLPNPLQFIILHSSYHPMLQNLDTKSVVKYPTKRTGIKRNLIQDSDVFKNSFGFRYKEASLYYVIRQGRLTIKHVTGCSLFGLYLDQLSQTEISSGECEAS